MPLLPSASRVGRAPQVRLVITTGVTGRPWRASVTEWGALVPWDDVPALNWFVAADDRWHVPAEEQSVRQTRIGGTAVVETRLRVPRGDVVHRVFSVADSGGMTVVEIENESPMPVAVAFDRRDVLTERPIGDVPIEGIELPGLGVRRPARSSGDDQGCDRARRAAERADPLRRRRDDAGRARVALAHRTCEPVRVAGRRTGNDARRGDHRRTLRGRARSDPTCDRRSGRVRHCAG